MASILVKLFEHNLWANLKVCDVCSRLTEAQLDATVAGTAGSVRATLMHLARAEQRYVERLSGRTLTIHERDVWSGVESVRAAIEASGRALIDLAGRADPDEVFSVDYQGSARASGRGPLRPGDQSCDRASLADRDDPDPARRRAAGLLRLGLAG